jgi:hypothetical protein
LGDFKTIEQLEQAVTGTMWDKEIDLALFNLVKGQQFATINVGMADEAAEPFAGTMQQAMCRSVAEYFKGRQFLWSLPQSGTDGGVRENFWKAEDGAFRPKLRLPGRSFGLNDWRGYDNLALLSVINLSPLQYELLDLLGVPPEDVFQALSATILYQDLYRSSMREPLADRHVECVVPCLPSAAALARLLPGCDVQIMPEHLIPQLAEPLKRGPKPTGRTPDAERQRKSRAARRAAMEHAKERKKESV